MGCPRDGASPSPSAICQDQALQVAPWVSRLIHYCGTDVCVSAWVGAA